MSLGQWFRDYVYFPLGGSRVKSQARLVFNLFVVWSLTGIWHGASWNFVFWGLLYFVLLTFEKLTGIPGKFHSPWAKGAYRIFTMLCVIVGWVFFRAETMGAAVLVLKDLAGLGDHGLICANAIREFCQYGWFFLGAALCSTPVFRLAKQKIAQRSKALNTIVEWLSVPLYLFLLLWSVSYIMMGSHNPFIYFNF